MPIQMSRNGALATCLLAISMAVGSPASAQSRNEDCRGMSVPVSLVPGQLQTSYIYGELCVPAGFSSGVIQLLVHGITYDHTYWSFPDPTGGSERYNYVAAANNAESLLRGGCGAPTATGELINRSDPCRWNARQV